MELSLVTNINPNQTPCPPIEYRYKAGLSKLYAKQGHNLAWPKERSSCFRVNMHLLSEPLGSSPTFSGQTRCKVSGLLDCQEIKIDDSTSSGAWYIRCWEYGHLVVFASRLQPSVLLPCLSLSLVRSFQDHLGSVTLVYLAVLKKNQEFETCDQRERRDRTSQDAQQEFIAGPGNGPCHLCHRGRCLHGLLSTEL